MDLMNTLKANIRTASMLRKIHLCSEMQPSKQDQDNTSAITGYPR